MNSKRTPFFKNYASFLCSKLDVQYAKFCYSKQLQNVSKRDERVSFQTLTPKQLGTSDDFSFLSGAQPRAK